MVTLCRCKVHKDVLGRDSMLFESSKFRLSNELDCLEQTIIKRQQDLHEMDELLEKNKTDLAAIQIEVFYLCFKWHYLYFAKCSFLMCLHDMLRLCISIVYVGISLKYRINYRAAVTAFLDDVFRKLKHYKHFYFSPKKISFDFSAVQCSLQCLLLIEIVYHNIKHHCVLMCQYHFSFVLHPICL